MSLASVDGDDIYIRYDTGEEEWTNSDYLAEMKVAVGDEVENMSSYTTANGIRASSGEALAFCFLAQ